MPPLADGEIMPSHAYQTGESGDRVSGLADTVRIHLEILRIPMHTVYYLVHRLQERRLKYYTTLSGARIAQRARNNRLGFPLRVDRISIDHREYEQCLMPDLTVELATWVIEEDCVDSPDLLVDLS